MPFVLHGRTETDIPYSFVDVDNEAIFAKATNLLLDLGHRRIAAINAPQETFFAWARGNGYRRALEARGVSFDLALYHETVMTEDAGYKITWRVLEDATRPTAIVCGSIFRAVGVYRAIRHMDLEPGRDISVVAHDDRVGEIRAVQSTRR